MTKINVVGRNPYIVTKALNSYLKGSVIIAISNHLVTTTDALIVSWLIGSKALTSVNIIIPVLTLFSSLMIMLSTGASISISKSLGNRKKEEVDLSFSSSVVGAIVIGVISAVLTYRFSSEIVTFLVHGDPTLYSFALSYLKTFCYAVPILIVAGVIGNIVRTDGNTRLVSLSVWIGILTNVVLDYVFIKYLHLGIAGAAWATAINYLLSLIICLFHFMSAYNTIRWSNNIKQYFRKIFHNCKLGFSTSLNNILLAVSLFVINSMMMKYMGNEGIYCWAVCYQIFLILQMILSGIDTGIFAIGGVLLGEDDVKGLDYLYKRSVLYLIMAVLILSAVIIIFPEFFGSLFGNRGEDKLDLLPSVLKIFSLFLLPYALVMQVRAIYTILDRSILSLIFCIAPFVMMILFLFLSSIYAIKWIWWSFPASSWILLISLVFYTFIMHIINRNLRFFSLIPKKVVDDSYNVSVSMNEDDQKRVKTEISDFLEKKNVSDVEISYIGDVTEKVMGNILENLSKNYKKKRYFDINLRIKGGKIILILKDDGERLDRKKESEIMSSLNPGEGNEKIDNSVSENNYDFSSSYFYMNEQNTFTLNFNLVTS